MFLPVHQFAAALYYLWNWSDGVSGTILNGRNSAFPSSRRGTSSGNVNTDALKSTGKVDATLRSLTGLTVLWEAPRFLQFFLQHLCICEYSLCVCSSKSKLREVGGIEKDRRVMFAGNELKKGQFQLSGQLDCCSRQYLMEDSCKCQARKQ